MRMYFLQKVTPCENYFFHPLTSLLILAVILNVSAIEKSFDVLSVIDMEQVSNPACITVEKLANY